MSDLLLLLPLDKAFSDSARAAAQAARRAKRAPGDVAAGTQRTSQAAAYRYVQRGREERKRGEFRGGVAQMVPPSALRVRSVQQRRQAVKDSFR